MTVLDLCNCGTIVTQGSSHICPPEPNGDLANLMREVIRDEMYRQGLTQIGLAKKVGFSQKHINQILTGKATGSIQMWNDIADALGVNWRLSVVSDD